MGDMAKYQVQISGKARSMLLNHAAFLAQASIKAGEKLFDQFEEKVVSLEEMPERCTFYDNPYVKQGKYRKLSLGDHLLILFQIVGDKVLIELIIDARAENKHLTQPEVI